MTPVLLVVVFAVGVAGGWLIARASWNAGYRAGRAARLLDLEGAVRGGFDRPFAFDDDDGGVPYAGPVVIPDEPEDG